VTKPIALRHRCAALFLALALAAGLAPGLAQARQNVLFIFDEEQDLPGLALINRGLREVFQREMKDGVELYSEALHISQFKDPGYYGVLRDYFRRKYDGKRPDLIVAVMEPSLDFLLREGRALFPGVPIVICGADPSDVEGKALPGNVTGVLAKRTSRRRSISRCVFSRTPATSLSSGAPRDSTARSRRSRAATSSHSRASWPSTGSPRCPSTSFWPGWRTFPRTASSTTSRSSRTVRAARSFPTKRFSRIAAVANAPVYVSLDQFVGLGAVGGHVYSVATHGEQAAQIGVRILRGAAPASIPLVAVAAA
jgi:hypothetical protein